MPFQTQRVVLNGVHSKNTSKTALDSATAITHAFPTADCQGYLTASGFPTTKSGVASADETRLDCSFKGLVAAPASDVTGSGQSGGSAGSITRLVLRVASAKYTQLMLQMYM